MSPWLFNVCMDTIVREVVEGCVGSSQSDRRKEVLGVARHVVWL